MRKNMTRILIICAFAEISLFNNCSALHPGSSDLTQASSSGDVLPTLGLNWPVNPFEAEAGQMGGGSTIVGTANYSDRARGDLGGEASGRQAVTLNTTGDSVSFTLGAAESGANAIVIRFSIPDATNGGGITVPLSFSVQSPNGGSIYNRTLNLTSRYSWLYGSLNDGTALYNDPANPPLYALGTGSTHLYDEVQLMLNTTLQVGDVIQLQKSSNSGTTPITIDFVELETVPSPLPQPSGYLSLTSLTCGGVAFDVHHTGEVFDGADDSSYASVFNAVIGINPYNSAGSQTQEKDYYTNASSDALQDNSPIKSVGNRSMFQLADQNFLALQTCINQVVATGSRYSGVWIPPGRFYIRGALRLPSNVNIQGAGMWYTKLSAVDTEPPTAVTVAGVKGLDSTSGNFMFISVAGGSNNVTLANLSMFGNVTQRDALDYMPGIPMGIHGLFSNSTFDNLWVEHYDIGINFFNNSNSVTVSNSRVRNTFADGIDFYGATSYSTIENSQARSTGDDGFSLWAQGATLASVSQSNTVTNCEAALQWWGNGFAIYGGNASTITQSNAYDILNYPCVQASTQFVPTTLSTAAAMSATISDMNFYRCGGNGLSQKYGALLVGTYFENINGITFSNINIYDANYSGIDMRPMGSPAVTAVGATMSNVLIENVNVLHSPACGIAGDFLGGSLQLNNVCYCSSVSSSPAACTATNASSATFTVSSVSACTLSSCQVVNPVE